MLLLEWFLLYTYLITSYFFLLISRTTPQTPITHPCEAYFFKHLPRLSECWWKSEIAKKKEIWDCFSAAAFFSMAQRQHQEKIVCCYYKLMYTSFFLSSDIAATHSHTKNDFFFVFEEDIPNVRQGEIRRTRHSRW